MICKFCGHNNTQPGGCCARCQSILPDPTCVACGQDVEWGVKVCHRCENKDVTLSQDSCPSCRALNPDNAEYCRACGAPMAVITKVIDLRSPDDVDSAQTWRVYGITTQLVGRDTELERLQYWHDEAITNTTPCVVRITSASGLGKNRLIAEFQRKLDEAFCETVFMQAACRENGSHPYQVFARLLKNRCYISDQDPEETIRRKFQEAVHAIIDSEEQATRICHLVGYLLGIRFKSSSFVPEVVEAESAGQLQMNCFEAVAELLRADASRNPLVIALRNLQYVSSQSLQLLTYLFQHLQNAPILFILSWGNEEARRELLDLPADESLELLPLSDNEVEVFVRDTLRKVVHLPQELVTRVVESAHGHPLAVEEILRILISDGVIDTRKQHWTVDLNQLHELILPTTVEDTVQARLMTLTQEELMVLEMAASIGRFFWPKLVRTLYNWRLNDENPRDVYWEDTSSYHCIDTVIESLERKDMIRRHENSWIRGTEEFHFKHRIEHRAIYAALDESFKRQYHLLIAQWVERNSLADRERIVELAANHFEQAHHFRHAALRFAEAADIARSHYANQKAVELYEKALNYLGDADIDRKLQIFHDLGSVYDFLGEHDDALKNFARMLRDAWILNDPNKGGVAFNKLGRVYRSIGIYGEALTYLQKALELFQQAEDLRGVASTLDDIGKIHWIRGHYEQAWKFFSSGLELRRQTNDTRSIALSLNHLGSLKLQRGELRDAMIYFRESLELRKSIDDRQGLADSFNNLGALCMERGDVEQAKTLFEEALRTARPIGHRALEGIVLNNIGEVYLISGDIEQAKKHLTEAMHVAQNSGDKRVLFDVLRNFGRTALKESDRSAALKHTQQALELAQQLDAEILHGIALHSIADVHAHYIFDPLLRQESITNAESCYRSAIQVLKDVGNDSLLGRCLSSYGNFLLEQGQIIQGKKQLEMAREIFKRLEMRKLWDATEALIHEL